MRGFFVPFCLMILALAVPPAASQNQAEKPLLVFAAASLKQALEPIAADFERETGTPVTLSFAATSALARQLAAGAPADVFISADVDWVAWLQAENLVEPETRIMIARNRLALVTGPDTAYSDVRSLTENILLWRDSGDDRLAVADPDHVPAGRYARAALTSLESEIGPYELFQERLAIGNNVRLAGLFVAQGAAPLGIVYLSDARVDPDLRLVGVFDDTTHPPIIYPAIKTIKGSSGADGFLTYLGTPEVSEALKAAGLLPPYEGG